MKTSQNISFGFIPFAHQANKLFITVADVALTLASLQLQQERDNFGLVMIETPQANLS